MHSGCFESLPVVFRFEHRQGEEPWAAYWPYVGLRSLVQMQVLVLVHYVAWVVLPCLAALSQQPLSVK